MELIFLKPYMKEVIWGGDKIEKEFGYSTDSKSIGEAWIVSANDHGYSTVINGEYKGLTLKELWEKHKNIFGVNEEKDFPFLIKYIDARDNLSIQVHPDDKYARLVENEPNGKSECWYILDCEKESDIIIGHTAKTKEEFSDMINNKQWDKLLKFRKIKKGDFFDIPAGTVHAIRKGTLILEVQQNSDITYRLYDYDRMQNGKLRPLHIKKSIDVVKCPEVEQQKKYKKTNDYTELLSNDKFTIRKYNVKNQVKIDNDKNFFVVCVIEGQGFVNGKQIKKGDNFIVPYEFFEINLEGDMQIIYISK